MGFCMVVIDAVIMAAGQSKRMGENKLLLPLGESTVIEQFLNKFPYDLFHKVTVVYSDNDLVKCCEPYPVKLCENKIPDAGKSHTICLGQQNSMNSEGVMYLVADQPLLKRESIQKLINIFKKNINMIVMPVVGEKSYNPVIFPSVCYEELMSLSGDNGGKSIVKNHYDCILPVVFEDEAEFMDIDTKEAYEKVCILWH